MKFLVLVLVLIAAIVCQGRAPLISTFSEVGCKGARVSGMFFSKI